MNYLPDARTENIVIQDFAKELLIYDLVSNKALCLNETSKIIWQACDGKTTFDEFRKRQNLQFTDELIWLALDQLKRDNLLDKNERIAVNFNGLTRREVVRKIGFASIVTLPLISAIVAPTALHAQSDCLSPFVCDPVGPLGNNRPLAGCPCINDGGCAGGCICGNPCQSDASCPPNPNNPNPGGGFFPFSCLPNGSCGGTCPSVGVCDGFPASICIPGNISGLSAPCCPCLGNFECERVCIRTPQQAQGFCVS